jgi:hypothetical protein
MTYILRKDRPENSYEEAKLSWKAYEDYLESIKSNLPPSVYTFATEPWHYNTSDPKCPHDAWLDDLIIHENAEGNRKQHRSIEIIIRLLGAYHDGNIELIYKNVKSYSLTNSFDTGKFRFGNGHGDWLYDEIRLSENNLVLHEIEWWLSASWLIECEDIIYKWIPFENQNKND